MKLSDFMEVLYTIILHAETVLSDVPEHSLWDAKFIYFFVFAIF